MGSIPGDDADRFHPWRFDHHSDWRSGHARRRLDAQ